MYNCDFEVKAKAYKTLVRPQLEYSSAVWGPYHIKDITQIESVQNKLGGFVLSKYSSVDSVTQIKKDLSWDEM